MNDKVIFGSLIGAVGVLLLVAIFRPAPEPRVVKPAETAAEETSAPATDSSGATEPATEPAAEDTTAEATQTEAAEAEAPATETATETAPATEEAPAPETETAQAETTEAASAEPEAQAPEATEAATEEAEPAAGDDVAALNARIAELEAKLAAAQSALETPAAASGTGVGETLVLADGAVRVFVSRITEEAARLSVNGETVTLAQGETASLDVNGETCGLTLDTLAASGIAASIACGAAPASEAAADTAEDSSAAAPDTAAPDTAAAAPEAASGAGVGETLVLAGGAVRVFVSRIADGTARLSANGQSVTLAPGEREILTLNGETCGLSLDGLEEGAAVSLACGDALPAPEGASVGETLLLEDGAIRAFVSRVTETDARLSVNGALVTLTPGTSTLTAGEQPCKVTLDGIDRGHVTLSSTCDAGLAASDPAGPGETVVLGDGTVRVFVSAVTRDAVRFAINGQTTQTASEGSSMMLENGCTLAIADVANGGASFALGCSE